MKKLGYSIKFSKKVLQMRRNVLGIRLLKLKKIIETSALKLHIGYKRAKTRIAKLININKDMQFIESGYNLEVIVQQKKQQTLAPTQSNHISNILNKRKLDLINTRNQKDQ